MGFPQLGNIDKAILDTIMPKAGNNLRASQTMPWMRVISCLGGFLAIESAPKMIHLQHDMVILKKVVDWVYRSRCSMGTSVYMRMILVMLEDLRPSPTIDSVFQYHKVMKD